MKLEPRTRTKAALFELDRDSNYLLLFRNASNAHLYAKSKQVKKATIPKAKKQTVPKQPAPTQTIPQQRPAIAQRTMVTINKNAVVSSTKNQIWLPVPSAPKLLNVPWQWRSSDTSEWNDYASFICESFERDYQKWLEDGKPHTPSGSLSNFHEMKNGTTFIQRLDRVSAQPSALVSNNASTWSSSNKTQPPTSCPQETFSSGNLHTSTQCWEYVNDTGKWVPFHPLTSNSIEDAYQVWKSSASLISETKTKILPSITANFGNMEVETSLTLEKSPKILKVRRV